MSKYIILPDVTCDLSKEMRDYFGLEDYLMGYVTINGKEMKTRLDWENISRDNFYKTLGSKKNQVSSAAPTPEEYYQAFKKYVDNGYSVLSIFFFHLFINVGMVLGLTPVIGIPLPFFSYGGSSLWGFTILLFVFLRIDAGRITR